MLSSLRVDTVMQDGIFRQQHMVSSVSVFTYASGIVAATCPRDADRGHGPEAVAGPPTICVRCCRDQNKQTNQQEARRRSSSTS